MSLEYIRTRYSDFFLETGSKADFDKLLRVVEEAVDTAVSDDVPLIKLLKLKDAERFVDNFAETYRKLPPTIVNNCVADLLWTIEQARETVTILWIEANKK